MPFHYTVGGMGLQSTGMGLRSAGKSLLSPALHGIVDSIQIAAAQCCFPVTSGSSAAPSGRRSFLLLYSSEYLSPHRTDIQRIFYNYYDKIKAICYLLCYDKDKKTVPVPPETEDILQEKNKPNTELSHLEDLAFKSAADYFGDELIHWLGIPERAVRSA